MKNDSLPALHGTGEHDMAVKIFISYAQEDIDYCERLQAHLTPLVRERIIETWTEAHIEAGQNRNDQVDKFLMTADIVLFLVSADFLASDYLFDIELKRTLERHTAGEIKVIPIILRPVDWQSTPFSKFQALPSNSKPITSWEDLDRAWLDVVQGLRIMIDDFQRQQADGEPGPAEEPNRSPRSERRQETGSQEGSKAVGIDLEEKVPSHPDDPSLIDELGRQPFAQIISARIQEIWSRSSDPAVTTDKTDQGHSFTVHIYGPWGIGKTSVLNFIRDVLTTGGKTWVTIDFNAWRHQRINPPWWPLIRETQLQARDQVGAASRWSALKLRLTWYRWLLNADILPVILTIILILFGLGFVIGIGADPNTPKTWQSGFQIGVGALAAWTAFITMGRSLAFGSARAAESYLQLRTDPMRPIVRLFQSLIAAIRRPVLIIIDDLDRCDPDYVVDLLEGIQTLFQHRDVAYVIAADRDWICASFEKRFENLADAVAEPGRPLGHLFLEKIFQLSAPVPRIDPTRQRQYWQALLHTGSQNKRRETVLAEHRAQADELLLEARSEDDLKRIIAEHKADLPLFQALREGSAKKISMPEARREAEHRLQPYAGLLEPNPRAMKRLVNSYAIRQAVNFLEERDVSTPALALWTILDLRWPVLADRLSQRPDLASYLLDDTRNSSEDAPNLPAELEDLKTLLRDPAVAAVMQGEGTREKTCLDEATIRLLVGTKRTEPVEPAAPMLSSAGLEHRQQTPPETP